MTLKEVKRWPSETMLADDSDNLGNSDEFDILDNFAILPFLLEPVPRKERS